MLISKMLVNLFDKIGLGLGTKQLVDSLAALDEEDGRNAGDAIIDR